MRALTVRQPWAAHIVMGTKTIENRTGPGWSYRGPLAVHAGAAPDSPWAFERVERLTGQPVLLGAPREGPQWDLGSVVGVVDLVDAHTEDACRLGCSPWALSSSGRDGLCARCRAGECRVDHAPAIHYELARPRALRLPVAAKGRLQIWRLDERTAQRVRFGLDRDHPTKG